MDVLPLCCLGFEELPKSRPIFRRRLLPVLLNRIPAFTQALLVRIPILGDDGRDALWMCQRQTQTDWGTVVEYIDRIILQPNRLRKTIDDLGDVFKGVSE